MMLIIDERQLTDGAIAWWKSLDTGTRGVFMQALWEVEGEPEPRPRKEAAQSQQGVPSETEETDRYSFRKARGAIPYREGQERSEDIIRRGRGGDV